MAAPVSPTIDKGRPPDTPVFGRKLYGKYSYVTTPMPANSYLNSRNDRPYIGFNEILEDKEIKLVQDVNKNNLSESPTKMANKFDKTAQKSDKNLLKHGFPKILCLKKTSICGGDTRSNLKMLNVNSLENLNANRSEQIASKTSLDKNESTTPVNKSNQEPDFSTNYYPEKPKNRNSFHQNVEEALSSLLWQPYEYQNQNNNEYSISNNGNENYDYESYSTCSYTPSTSPISLDLDDTFDNAASSPSNTKNVPSSTFLQCTAAVPPLYRRDLHFDVINLNRQEVRGQSGQVFTPRDGLLQRSGTGAFVSLPSLASSLLDSEDSSVPHAESVTSCTGEFSGESSMHGGSGSASGQQNVPLNGLTASNSENGLKSGPIKVDSSLNSANIVGLPSSHVRYASVPCSSTSASFQSAHAVNRSQNVGYPQHFRNVSEPSQQVLRYSNSNNGQGVPVVHQKSHANTGSNSEIDQHNLQLINHFRSSSVPKSMTLVPKYDVTASSGVPGSLRVKGSQVLQQNVNNNLSYGPSAVNANNNNNIRVATNKPTNISVSSHSAGNTTSPFKHQVSGSVPSVLSSNPNGGNVSNVNVNFYRAVPVNVVSSVPTIHCLNTLSNDQGNSVSNVQVLPLGNGGHQPPLHANNYANTNHQLSVANSVKNVDHQKVFDDRSSANSGQVTVYNINPISTTSDNSNQMITTTVGYPEQGFRNVVTNSTNTSLPNGSSTVRGTIGVPVSGTNGLVRNILLQNVNQESYDLSNTGFFTPALPAAKANNVISVQNTPVFATEVPYHQAGRIITTTAQINSSPTDIHQQPAACSGNNIVRTRTFTSTEAQTDEILPAIQSTATQNQNATNREQKRRERRERRQNRRNHNHNNGPRTTNDSSTQAGGGTVQTQTQTACSNNSQQENRLPDILNSHLPPPYSTLPSGQNASMVPPIPPQILPSPIIPGAMLPNPPGPVLQTVVPNGVPASAFVFPAPQQMAPLMQGGAPVPVAVPATAASGFRFGFPANGFRRSRFSDDSPKGCCGFLSWKPGSLRWFIALIALVAVCCVLVGTALGAMRPAGRDHLTVSLLMIGVGIVLITVSGVAWRLTSHDSSTCRSMLGLGSTESVDVCTRRFVPRLPPSYGRPHHPYAAMMYPEFQYRPPPPSYQASMQEYRLRLLLLDRGNTPQIQAGIQNAVSPPPTYRSHAGSLLRAPLSSRRETNQSEYSCPPSYRSQNSSNRPGTLPNGSILHSRDPSLTMSDSNQESVVNVVNILGSTEEDIALDNITLDSLKMEPESSDINPLKMLLKGSQSDLEGSKDGNLVTIVQTSDQNPVIVTVSGCSAQDNNSTVQITEIPTEMEILAHL